MTSKKKVDISKAPEEKKDLTKEFIQAYLEKNNTPENKEWLNDLYNKDTKEELGMDKVLQEKKNKYGSYYVFTDYFKQEFVKKFFPDNYEKIYGKGKQNLDEWINAYIKN